MRNFTSGAELIARYRSGERYCADSDFSSLRAVQQDLTGSDFSRCSFSNAVLGGSEFDGCNFTQAEFHRTNSLHGSFIGCDFTGASLLKSAFGQSDFFEARFHDTSLRAGFRGHFLSQGRIRIRKEYLMSI
jgi:uncharacterized protein YjbI with pentapeptide repeats